METKLYEAVAQVFEGRGEKKVEGMSGKQLTKVLDALDEMRDAGRGNANVSLLIKDLKSIEGKVKGFNVSKILKELKNTQLVLKQLGKDCSKEYTRLNKILGKWMDENE